MDIQSPIVGVGIYEIFWSIILKSVVPRFYIQITH